MNKKLKSIKIIMAMFRPFWKNIAFILSLMLVGQALGLLSPYVFGKSLDAVSNNIYDAFTWVGIGFISFIVRNQILLYIREKHEIKYVDSKIANHLGSISLNKMLTFSIGQHVSEHSGVKQSIVSQGQSNIQQLVFDVLYNIFPPLIQIVATTVILFFFSPILAMFVLVVVLLFAVLMFRLNIKYKEPIEVLRKKNQDGSKLYSEIYRNLPLTILEGQEEKAQNEYKENAVEIQNYQSELWSGYISKYFLVKGLIGIGQYGSLILACYFIYTGQFGAGMFVTIFGWTAGIFGPIEQLSSFQRKIMLMMNQIKKYLSFLEIKPDIYNDPDAVVMKDVHGKIEFKNVSFSYPKRDEKTLMEDKDESEFKEDLEDVDSTITDVSFVINAGEKIGIVGESGSGKSTVIALLRRYYDPIEGEVLVDDIPLKKIEIQSLRKNIGNVEQDVALFDRTIRENITYSLDDPLDFANEELDKVTEMASINNFIYDLPQKYDTLIGEKGIKLSGGERQRIAIARALAKNPKILIFDEATSALDSNNEKIIHDAINESSKGRTTIIVAHRLSTVIDADKIFVMSKGRLVAEGTHTVLQITCPEYQDLIKNQIVAF
jgi:ABC-type multidrug transport system fused ATPase/permease subunit